MPGSRTPGAGHPLARQPAAACMGPARARSSPWRPASERSKGSLEVPGDRGSGTASPSPGPGTAPGRPSPVSSTWRRASEGASGFGGRLLRMVVAGIAGAVDCHDHSIMRSLPVCSAQVETPDDQTATGRRAGVWNDPSPPMRTKNAGRSRGACRAKRPAAPDGGTPSWHAASSRPRRL